MRRHARVELFVHLVWATSDRLPLLASDVQKAAYRCIQAECTNVGAEVLAIGGTEDHVHLLTRIPATLSVSVLVKQIKGASSHLIAHHFGHTFKWQGGYGAFSVSRSLVPRVREYILNQEQHHRDGTIYPGAEVPTDPSG